MGGTRIEFDALLGAREHYNMGCLAGKRAGRGSQPGMVIILRQRGGPAFVSKTGQIGPDTMPLSASAYAFPAMANDVHHA